MSNEELDKLQDEILDRITEEMFDELFSSRWRIYEAERECYLRIVGKSKDKVDAIMRYFNMDDSRIDEAEEIVDFYEMFEEMMREME